MDSPRKLKLATLGLWLLLGVLSYAFGHTEGLAYSGGPGELAHVRELESSGGNDDLAIELGVVFAGAALLWGALRFRSRFGFADPAVQGLLLAGQVAYLAAIEAGSIGDTLTRDRNPVLALWLLTLLCLGGCALLGGALVLRGRRTHRAAGGDAGG